MSAISGMRRERLEETHGPHSRRCLVSRPVDGQFNGLVVVLHGAGATAAWMFQEVGLEEWAGQRGLILAFPEATRVRMDKPPHLLDNTPCWEDGSTRRMPRPAVGADDFGWLAGLIGRLLEDRPVPVVLAGFSNGASMALRLAAGGLASIRGVLAIGGYPRSELPAEFPPVKTVFVHGRLDPIVPPGGGWVKTPWQPEGYAIPPMSEAVGNWCRLMEACHPRRQVAAEFEETRFSDPSGKVWCRWLMVDRLGHHWPGGKGQWESEAMGPRLNDGPVDVKLILDGLVDSQP